MENLKNSQIEVLDRTLRPFCVLRETAVLAQGLLHREAAVLAWDGAGRLILAGTPSGYDVSAFGLLLAGEGRADCAERLMREAFGHAPPMGAPRELRLENRLLSVFSCRMPADALLLAPLKARDWLWATPAEIQALLASQPELFAPLFRRIMRESPGVS